MGVSSTRIAVSMAIAFFLTAGAVAQTTSIKEVSGKVEFRAPGKEWRPAKVGQDLPKGAMISTGFKSVAVITIGAATVTVKPLTRLTLEEIVQREGSQEAKLYLVAGRVRAEVTPETGTKVDFSVKSPTATASVRGTGFDFDGINLTVQHGIVVLENATGQWRTVTGGESSTLLVNTTVEAPVIIHEMQSTVLGVSDFTPGSTSDGSTLPIIPPVITPEAIVSFTID